MHMHINIAKLFYYICIYHTYNSQYKVNIKFHTTVKLYIKIRRFKCIHYIHICDLFFISLNFIWSCLDNKLHNLNSPYNVRRTLYAV